MNSGRLTNPLLFEENVQLMAVMQKRCGVEASKVRERLGEKILRYEGYIDRLERRAGSQFQPGDEGTFVIIFLHFLS